MDIIDRIISLIATAANVAMAVIAYKVYKKSGEDK